MTKQSNYQTGIGERISYPLFTTGQTLIFGFIGQFLPLYFSDYLLLPPLAISVIFLVAKIWDAVNDPIFGMIVDRVNFRNNKFKPWLRVTAFAVPVFTILIFWISPNWSMTAKISLAALGYILWSMIYTVSDVPSFSLLTSMTSNNRERTSLLSFGSVAGAVAAILIVIVFSPQVETIGFPIVATMIGLLAIPFLAPYPFLAKERNRLKKPKSEKQGFKAIFKYLKENKYLAIFYLSFCINGVLNLSLTLTNYVMIYCLGGLKYLAIFTAIGVVPLIILYLMIPKLSEKIDRMTMYKFCMIVSLVLNVVIFFVGYGNIWIYGTLVILRTVIATPSTMLVATATTDCMEYGHYKTGLRKEGLTFSLQTFANKFNNAIASSLAMALLSVIGYVGGDVQTPATLSGLWFCANIIPAIGTAISLPLLHFYKLKCKDAQIMTDINSGKISREEGENLMTRKY